MSTAATQAGINRPATGDRRSELAAALIGAAAQRQLVRNLVAQLSAELESLAAFEAVTRMDLDAIDMGTPLASLREVGETSE